MIWCWPSSAWSINEKSFDIYLLFFLFQAAHQYPYPYTYPYNKRRFAPLHNNRKIGCVASGCKWPHVVREKCVKYSFSEVKHVYFSEMQNHPVPSTGSNFVEAPCRIVYRSKNMDMCEIMQKGEKTGQRERVCAREEMWAHFWSLAPCRCFLSGVGKQMKVGRDGLWSCLLCANHMAVPTLLPSCRSLSGLSPSHTANLHANLFCVSTGQAEFDEESVHPLAHTHTHTLLRVIPQCRGSGILIKDGICIWELLSWQRPS